MKGAVCNGIYVDVGGIGVFFENYSSGELPDLRHLECIYKTRQNLKFGNEILQEI